VAEPSTAGRKGENSTKKAEKRFFTNGCPEESSPVFEEGKSIVKKKSGKERVNPRR